MKNQLAGQSVSVFGVSYNLLTVDTARLSARHSDPQDGIAFSRLQGSAFPFGKNGEAPSLYKNVAIGDKLDLSSLLTEYSIPFCVGKLSQL